MMQKLYITGMVLFDAVLLSVTPLVALWLRFDGAIPDYFLLPLLYALPAIVVFQLAIFYVFNIYRRVWKYAGVNELVAIVGAMVTGEFLLLGVAMFLDVVEPRSAYLVHALLNIGGVGLSLLYLRQTSINKAAKDVIVKRILIVGAGRLGVAMLKEIRAHYGNKREIVGFITDNPMYEGKILNKIPVLGDRRAIKDVVKEKSVDEIVVAMNRSDKEWLRQMVLLCREANCSVKVVPSFREMMDGEVSLRKLREINLSDLLGREAVLLDVQSMRACLEKQTVLITGAGGSIGSEICRQVAKLSPGKMILLGKSENNIYDIEQELRWNYPALLIEAVIADVSNSRRINRIFEKYRPAIVFHAAAHKHVPLMEAQPIEAVHVNVFGTRTVACAALKNGAERFVMVSTDKAINPTSVMGATKRAAEILICQLNQKGKTKFAAVRFGNVLGSRGSVIPLFRKQIANGGPVKVTHPDMERYFMTIPEAAQLVLQAGAMAQGGEVFVLDMGDPVKIVDLACALIELSGYRPYKDLDIEFSGLRPGEKLYEEILSREEEHTATHYEKIYKAKLQSDDSEKVESMLALLEPAEDDGEIRNLLMQLVPTYTCPKQEKKELGTAG